MKFIHAADLHIDSQLRGLSSYVGAPGDLVCHATRDSFENIVNLALAERVDFVLIAGDLFDGKWNDISTGIWTARQFRRLQQQQIPVYIVRGNHDAASQVRQAISWPDNVVEFSVDRPETHVLPQLDVAIHGQGFARREVTEDLAAGFPAAKPEMFNIGMLHTSLTGDPQHDTYAPTTEDVLVGKGYDYWALGHIHTRRIVRQEPFIAFAGNSQGRHIRETGAKGCLLVSLERAQLPRVEFRATDTLRWHHAEIELAETDGVDELYGAVREQLHECHLRSEGRFAAVRLVIRGACAAHSRLVRADGRAEVIGEIRNLANELHEMVWTEKIRLETTPVADLAELRQGPDLMGDLLQAVEQLAENDDQLRELAAALGPLLEKAPLELSQAGIDAEDPQQLRIWLRQAEGLLVSMLWEPDK